jgi:hypothetical protein
MRMWETEPGASMPARSRSAGTFVQGFMEVK